MSLSLTDTLQVVFAPAQVSLLRIGRELTARGLTHPLRESRSLVCLAAGPGASAWGSALDALGNALTGIQRPLGPSTVVLSNQFVRYVVVPWSDELANADEDEAFARHCFSDLYGDIAERWELRLSPGRIGAPRIACATDRNLLEALREIFGRAQLVLHSIQPHLMSACNGARRRLRGRSAWVVLAEAGVVCIGLLRNGAWVRIRNLRVGPNWHKDLPVLLEREALMADGETPREVIVLASDRESISLPRWQVEWLPDSQIAARVPAAGVSPVAVPAG